MKTAESLLLYMDRIQDFFEMLDSWLEQGMKYLHEAKVWLEKILNLIEQGINALAEKLGQTAEDIRHNHSHNSEEHLFV